MKTIHSCKQKLLNEFVAVHKDLAPQGSKKWLDERKYNIGGSEMNVITGDNPYKSIRGLIEGHLGLSVFKGNINTYWGSILEDYVTHILEKQWSVKIIELGSLPGVIKHQKYSPDGLVYLPYLDKIVLLEIKNAARRLTNGRIPTMYKPQIFTGLDTIQIADVAMFIDVMFRRCSPDDFCFNEEYDYRFHGKKRVDKPLALCMMVLHCDGDNNEVCKVTNRLKDEYGLNKDEQLDLGSCKVDDLETVLGLAASKRIDVEFSPLYEAPITFSTLANHAKMRYNEKKREIVGIVPMKLFKFNITPVERHDWKNLRKLKNVEVGDSYVKVYEKKINETIEIIRQLELLSPDKQIEQLDKLYPPKEIPKIDKFIEDDLIASMLV